MPALTDQDGHVAQVTADGFLQVVGGGAAPSATSLKILGSDGVSLATVSAGSLQVSSPVGASTEATLIQIRDYLDTVELKLQDLVTSNATGATETTLLLVRDYLDTVETKLQSLITNTTTNATEATLVLIRDYLDTVETKLQSLITSVTLTQGTWNYYSGVSGTVAVTAGQRVLGIAAHATVAGSLAINGGSSVPVPANSSISITPEANLVAPSIVFTGTDSYFIETVS